MEVKPTAAAAAVKLARQFRDATRKEPGNLRAVALQRIGQAHQLVLLEAWKDQAAADAHFKTPATVQFRDKIKAIRNAPIDDRVHFPLSGRPARHQGGRRGGGGGDARRRDPAAARAWVAITKGLLEDSRKETATCASRR